MKNNVVFTFHMGYTDVINSLPLIDHYLTQYYNVCLVSTPNHKKVIDFYIRDKPNVEVVYDNNPDDAVRSIAESNQWDIKSHGFHDGNRSDEYRGAFANMHCRDQYHFVRLFYEAYNIPYITRVNSFNISRDFDIEENAYRQFTHDGISDYIIFHSDIGDRFIEDRFQKRSDINYFNVNGKADNIFSCIKILENAKELHLVDSVWACLCYLLDAKYRIFADKPIYLYPFSVRSGGCIGIETKHKDIEVLEPVKLDNWIIRR